MFRVLHILNFLLSSLVFTNILLTYSFLKLIEHCINEFTTLTRSI